MKILRSHTGLPCGVVTLDHLPNTKAGRIKNDRVSIYTTTSYSLKIDDPEVVAQNHPEYLEKYDPVLKNAEIKQALLSGVDIQGSHIESSVNLQIK